MTDDIEPTPEDEKLQEEAKTAVETPAEPVPGAEALPEDVADGHIEDEPGT